MASSPLPAFLPAVPVALSPGLPVSPLRHAHLQFRFVATRRPAPPTLMTTSSTSQTDATALTTPATIPLPVPPREPLQLPQPFPAPAPLPTLGHVMKFTPANTLSRLSVSLRLLRKIRGRFPKSSVLSVALSGALSENQQPTRPFSPPELTLPALTQTLRLAAHDPRIAHLHVRIGALACGWATLMEVRRHIDYFSASGKSLSFFMEAGGPKEFFVAMGYALYVPPDASLSLRGFTASGSFLRGALDKIGVSPQVQRIGKYKSAGDQLSRTDMAPAQREVLQALLQDIDSFWTDSVVAATGLTVEALRNFIDRSPWDMTEYVDIGLVTAVSYESEVMDALKLRFAPRGMLGASDKQVMQRPWETVPLLKYAKRISPRTFGLQGRKRIAVIRAVGVITPGKSGSSAVAGATVGCDTLVELIRKAKDDKRVVGVIIRIDSPGGAALASDIVWNELRALRAVKPVVASQVDAAASGGYYLSMACEIVSELLTVTGSVGVVTAKPSLAELYRKVGISKENVSVGGRFAELLVDDRPFSEEEMQYFTEGTRLAYDSFVGKAAQSRGKSVEAMEEVAQGRVWTGGQARACGLVDHVGGMWKAVEVMKERCGIEEKELVNLEEFKVSVSLVERLGLGGAGAGAGVVGMHTLVEAPMAMAEVDGSLGQASPLTKVVLDVAVSPITRQVARQMYGGSGVMQSMEVMQRLVTAMLQE